MRLRRWVLVTVGVGTFMSALDGSVVNTILPLLARELGTGVAGIEWVTTVYLLVVSGLLLGVGRLGDLRGHKRIYVAGFVLFVLGSALCGLAPSAPALVGLRVVQAVGAAMLYATSPAILTAAFPPERRGRALGALGTFTYLGLTAGPSLGGWLADAFGWRAVFYINVPVGALAIALAVRVIADDRPARHEERFDVGGALLFTVGLVALLVALNQGHAWGWRSTPTLILLLLALAVLAAFVGVERRRPFPMLDLTLFRSRTFSAATASALLNYVCVYSVLFVLPFLLIQGRGLDTRQAGLVLTAQPVVMAVVAPISGTLSDRVGARLPATLGMLLLTAGLVLLAELSPAASLGAIAGAMAVIGLGVGIFVSPNNSALMGAAPRHRQGIASGVLATARNVGMVLGVGLAGAVFTTVLAHAGGTGAGALVQGVRASLLVAAGVAAVGAVTSVLR
ncbi:MAG TPA: DHA2 family efflux MFS transporter permease subunit [Gemmatimonadaceae bacterium]|nr:DHA2 family efflux MFS transporter permease subunit [Gemmatimonadaceae bacterium]